MRRLQHVRIAFGLLWSAVALSMPASSAVAVASWADCDIPNTGVTPQEVFFLDEAHGWVLSSYTVESANPWDERRSVLWRTDDGGDRWDTSVPPTDTVDLDFSGANDGWAVGAWGGIYETSDAGATWTEHRVAKSLGFNALYFACVDVVGDGLVVAGGNAWRQGADVGGVVVISDDGGSTWRTHLTGLPGSVNRVSFLDSQRGWLTQYVDVADGTVLRTGDGGITWDDARPMESGAPIRGDYRDMKFSSGGRGWLVGAEMVPCVYPDGERFFESRNRVWTVADGEQAWSVAADFLPQAASISLAGRSVWVGGQGVMVSPDEGATWRSTMDPDGEPLVTCVAAVEEGRVWAVGGEEGDPGTEGGAFLMTADVQSVARRSFTSFSVEHTPTVIVGSGSMTVSGLLRTSDTLEPVAGRSVELSSALTTRTIATTAADGSFTFTVRPQHGDRYSVRFRGDATHLGAWSDSFDVLLRPRLGTPSALRAAGKRRTYRFEAVVNPPGVKPRFGVERWSNHAWAPVYDIGPATSSKRTSSQRWRTSSRTLAKGRWRVRAFVPQKDHYKYGLLQFTQLLPARSAYRYVTVK